MTQNEYVYAICCWLEEAGDVISREVVETMEGYATLTFEVACFGSFRDIKKKPFVTAAEAAADIKDRIKRKGIRVSLKKIKFIYFYQDVHKTPHH